MSFANSSGGHHKVLIVGGGSAGLTLAARLLRSGLPDVAVLDPSASHYYQPLWTLVGGGRAPQRASVRPQSRAMPKGATWIRDAAAAVGVHPQPAQRHRSVHHAGWPGQVRGGPQKIAYLAADWWRRQGVLDRIRVILVLPTAVMFSQPDWAQVLTGIAAGYGIEVRQESQLTEVDGDARRAVIADTKASTKEEIGYDMMHVTPPQSAPDWVRASPLADPASPFGYVRADKHTLRHPQWPNVFALGDAANLPTSKTGAAIRKQSPVVAANVLAAMHGGDTRSYDGYTSCPLVTSRNRLLLAEFNYDLERTPNIPFIDTLEPRQDMYLLKRYGLPALYWQGMLKGRA